MNNSNMMNRMLSNWLDLGVNHMEVRESGKVSRSAVAAMEALLNRSIAPRVSRLSMQLALIGACAIVVPAYAADQVVLTGVTSVPLANNETELRLAFDSTPPNPQAYQLDKPARLVVDLPHTKSSLASRYQDLGSGNARSLAVVDNAERTRLVINLNQASGYSTRVEGNTLVLKVGGASVSALGNSSQTPQSAPIAGTHQVSNAIMGVDFRRGSAGEGNVLVTLNNPNSPVDVQQQGSKIIVRFLGTKLPESLRRRLDVNDFATPVKTIDAYNDGNNGILVIQPQGDFDYLSYQADNKLTISVKPVVLARPIQINKVPDYKGQKLSLNFQDIDVRSVLQLIADFTGLNLVASDSVTGKITIRLQNVPWDQALDIIMKSKGLDKRQIGNVIMIAPAEEIAAREKLEIQNNQQVEQLAPLSTQYIQLSYAKAADILTLITSGRNGGSGSGSGGVAGGANIINPDTNQGSLLSPRGTVSIDARTNTLIIQDTATSIDQVRDMISRLDVPVKQVMIEARIVQATDTFSKELGVQWGVLSHGVASKPNLLVGGSEQTLFDLRNPTTSSTGTTYTITQPQNLNVDLAATGAGASSIALGIMSMSDIQLDLTLSALQGDGKGEVIATPKVLTLDKQKARVAAGQQIPYQQATSSGATSVAFVNAELSLEVTPSITPDGRVQMDLLVNADSPGTAAPNGQLTINTNRIQTSVLVNDGQTLVLGGIFQNNISSSTTKVPFLGDLPYLGRLFRHSTDSNTKQELLIFVTPRILTDPTKENKAPQVAQQ